MAYFFDPDFDTLVKPFSESPEYQPVHYGEYLMHRLDSNYKYRNDKIF